MMKRVWALLLAMMLLALPVCASARTLQEKMQLQLRDGSGIKGTILLETDGEAEWLQALSPYTGVELHLKSISSGKETEVQFFLMDGDAEKPVLRLYSDGSEAGLTGPALNDSVILLPAGVRAANLLAGSTARPGWLPLLLGLLSAPEEDRAALDAAMEPFYSGIELWLADYASAPELTEDSDGSTLLLIRYEIAPAALRSEMLKLVQGISGSSAVMSVLRGIGDADAPDAYFGKDALAAAPEVIDGIELSGPAVLERSVTPRGETVLSKVTLPLAGADGRVFELSLKNDGTMALALREEKSSFRLTVDEHAELGMTETWKGTLACEGGDVPAVSLSYELSSEKSSPTVDEDGRTHELAGWKLAVKADEGSAVPSGEAAVTLHYHSLNGPTRPTTLQVFVTADVPDAHLALNVTVKTAKRWDIAPFAPGGERWLDMTPERRSEVLAQLLSGLASSLAGAAVIPVPEEIIDDTATPTDATPGDLP